MEWLTDFLAGGFEDPSERFPTAGLGVLELAHAWDDLKAGCARSVRVIRPRELVPIRWLPDEILFRQHPRRDASLAPQSP